MVTSALPRVLVAAATSGSGKTMLTTGLLAALARRGLVVSPHKVGPDYIDPGYHAAACGRPGRNLDAHLVGPDRLVPLLLHGASTPTRADVAVIEGVMGLFDGALGTRGFASSAYVAARTSTPVVLVVNCASASRSLGALVHGFATFDPGTRLGGVILNNLGSSRHESEVREAVAEAGVPVVGAVPRVKDIVVPSRHLGLIPAAEREPEALRAVDALADIAERHLDLDVIMSIARSAPELDGEAWSPEAALDEVGHVQPDRRPVVAVAAGAAFTFGYAETPELLRAAGAEVVTFDPLRDDRLPDRVDALVIGGGFPEVHAADLADNAALRAAVRDLAAAGSPVAAECAGLLYLGRSLDGAPMCGALPVDAEMGPRLTLGYRDAVAVADSVLGPEGARVRGHEFHRTRIVADEVEQAGGRAAWGWRDREGRPQREGYVLRGVHASYLHLNWAGSAASAGAFVSAAAGGVA